MARIEADDLRKVFRGPDKRPGLAGSLRHLVERRYTEKVAVDSISLRVEAGEAVAYVGPNGAGKSTTIKLLTGILVPTSGEVRVNGIVPHRNRVENARGIGVVFGQRTSLWWDLAVRDSLELLRDMHGLGAAEYRANLDRLVEMLGIGDFLSSTARRLSLGQRMRADLAAALLHNPPIVYLDEPTIGLDIEVKDRLRAFLRQIVAEGTTLVLTTHDLGEIEDVCSRLVIIDQGRIVHDGGLREVIETYARERVMHVDLAARPASLAGIVTRLAGATVVEERDGLGVAVTFDPLAHTAGDVLTAIQSELQVVDLRIKEPAIEDVVRRVYAGQLIAGPDDGPLR
ncbi:MAG TPA: ATP-binding cassette domain-containing protein [Cellulomonadaceae bacterium]|nr:ATP-binding cassette domain-containing protein [Cellulomonadaceae bacterium]